MAIIEYANSLGLGNSTFVSVGNKADISGNDLLRYWESDDGTDVILLYLESFGNPKKFSQIARRVGRKKPIVVVKSGRSAAGARATSSHTGALIAASDVTVDALFRQAGVIRTDTLAELFDVASLLANQPLPRGNRVGIITNAGGPAILCADACEARGLEVPVLEKNSQQKLRSFLLSGASASNPVDMIASASADDYRRAIEIVVADNNVNALIVIFTPPLVTRAEDVALAIVNAVKTLDGSKPVMAVFLSAQGAPEELRSADVNIPSYGFPETAAIALARAARYREWRERPEATAPQFGDIRKDEAAAVVAAALGRGEGWLTPEETATLCSCYGLPLVEQRFVASARDAAAAVERALAISGRHSWALMTLAAIYAAWGKTDKARAVFRELEARSTREYIQPAMLTAAAAAIGETDRAIAFAQQALDFRDTLFVMLARMWPDYERLRSDSRFLEIVGRLRLPGWSKT